MRFYISVAPEFRMLAAMGIVAILTLMTLVLITRRFFAEMRAEKLACRNCKSKSTHASFPGGLVDTALSLVDCIPYRCEVCSFRFYVRRHRVSAEPTHPPA